MGISFSCPFAKYDDVEDGLESVVVKSIDFGDEVIKTPVRSVSFKNQDTGPTVLKSLGSGTMMIEASVIFKRNEAENMILTKTMPVDIEKNMPTSRVSERSNEMDDRVLRSECQVEKIQSALLDPNNPKHMAAVKLQKVYKSFRTRRKLADCAIIVEQSWWKLLDFAELKHSSISFFDIEKHETAISRWSRARTRAAKVGKGLSKDDKAQKLALQHWLEAVSQMHEHTCSFSFVIDLLVLHLSLLTQMFFMYLKQIDPRHRYGHNLHFYYDNWLRCQSREPFFYWLDIGEGKEVNLEKCPRSKLQLQCIKYLGPMERLAYEVVLEDGRFVYKQSGELLHTTGGENAKWIFVLSTSKTLYVGKKKKGSFQHSSFLAGGATSAAGRLVVEYGVLKAVWPHSGHYRPTEENFKEFISFLQENDVNLSYVKMAPVDDDSGSLSQRFSGHIRSLSSDEDFTENVSGLETEETSARNSIEEKATSIESETASASGAPRTRQFQDFGRELTSLEIPKRVKSFRKLENEEVDDQSNESFQMESPTTGEEKAALSLGSKADRSDEKHDDEVETIPEESIVRRISSLKVTRSYQLGKQLSCKWTTGAGPRIGCVRDYPCELQFRALEQVNLSPRSDGRAKSFALRTTTGLGEAASTPSSLWGTSLDNTSMSQEDGHHPRSESLPLIRGTSVIPVIHSSD
ncbi:IQ domain-containing protein IQM2 isoform X1 [Prosopis cineraria]|uniref:IQ domain-containing protein IQM2 isoform X1 n=1 Tax=Prosopis cineraria TaxID=364024 RepID=UPI00240FFD88|nr:IQ domain-containing protein IQM2 isoform X1 [Prosopis cineraria]